MWQSLRREARHRPGKRNVWDVSISHRQANVKMLSQMRADAKALDWRQRHGHFSPVAGVWILETD